MAVKILFELEECNSEPEGTGYEFILTRFLVTFYQPACRQRQVDKVTNRSMKTKFFYFSKLIYALIA